MNITILEAIVKNSRDILGVGFTFYQTDGRVVYEMRGPSGGVVVARICYIIPSVIEHKRFPYYSVTFLNGINDVGEVQDILKKSVIEFVKKLSIGSSKTCDADGGELTTSND